MKTIAFILFAVYTKKVAVNKRTKQITYPLHYLHFVFPEFELFSFFVIFFLNGFKLIFHIRFFLTNGFYAVCEFSNRFTIFWSVWTMQNTKNTNLHLELSNIISASFWIVISSIIKKSWVDWLRSTHTSSVNSFRFF